MFQIQHTVCAARQVLIANGRNSKKSAAEIVQIAKRTVEKKRASNAIKTLAAAGCTKLVFKSNAELIAAADKVNDLLRQGILA